MHGMLNDGEDAVLVQTYAEREAHYHGMRLSAPEYFSLENDGCRYELIDGVVCISPSPFRKHQLVVLEIASQLHQYLKKHPVGEVVLDTDVYLGKSERGGDVVLRPDVMFFKRERVPVGALRYELPPDVIVEVASLSTRGYDRKTKMSAYASFGVCEYWIVNPQQETFEFFRLFAGRYEPVKPDGEVFSSREVDGFSLDISASRRVFDA